MITTIYILGGGLYFFASIGAASADYKYAQLKFKDDKIRTRTYAVCGFLFWPIGLAAKLGRFAVERDL